jgi:hypothetical protein
MDDRELIRSFEGVHDRRFLTFTGLALLAFVIVLGGVVAGFRGNHVQRSADAMSLVQPRVPRIMAAPPLR